MARCSTCALNTLGYCPVFFRMIPSDRIDTEHGCERWQLPRSISGLSVVERLAKAHAEDRSLWLVVEDMIRGDTHPPAGMVAAAWRLAWTAPYIDEATRAQIVREIVPF